MLPRRLHKQADAFRYSTFLWLLKIKAKLKLSLVEVTKSRHTCGRWNCNPLIVVRGPRMLTVKNRQLHTGAPRNPFLAHSEQHKIRSFGEIIHAQQATSG